MKPKLNEKLLRRIQKHLKEEPKRYDQRDFGEIVSGRGAPSCGTRGCIGGWAVFLSLPKKNWEAWTYESYSKIFDKAKALLGLTQSEAYDLFSHLNQKFITGKRGVREACEKIDDLIASRKTNQWGAWTNQSRRKKETR